MNEPREVGRLGTLGFAPSQGFMFETFYVLLIPLEPVYIEFCFDFNWNTASEQ